MESMKKKNLPITFGILLFFCVTAYIVNIAIDYNYMFLMRADGTPYSIFYDLLNGHRVFYPLCVVLMFIVYITIFYLVYYKIKKRKAK